VQLRGLGPAILRLSGRAPRRAPPTRDGGRAGLRDPLSGPPARLREHPESGAQRGAVLCREVLGVEVEGLAMQGAPGKAIQELAGHQEL